MYRNLLPIICLILSTYALRAQVVYTEPQFPTSEEVVTLFFDATQGDGGLANCNCDVYLHTGVVTNLSNPSSPWRYVLTEWGVANPDWKMTRVSNNLYSFTFTPSIRDFYGVPGDETIQQMAFVFRNGTGSQSGRGEGGQDVFYDVYEGGLLFQSPASSFLIVQPGELIPIRATATQSVTFSIFEDGNLVVEQTGNVLDYDLMAASSGTHEVEIIVDDGSAQETRAFTYLVAKDIDPADPPAGLEPGITFADGKLQLLLFAPEKNNVFVLGDFNDYQANLDYQMTPTDNGSWWIEIDGLPQEGPITFQYLVDGAIRVADPYSTLILDPGNDPFIPEETYPNLPEYPQNASGIVSLIDPQVAAYNWQVNNFQRPQREELVIYELLLRDFLERHDYTTLIDTLSYFQRLGVNAIELMPVNEFAGNISWGYNPTFHMALDKYYGPIYELKRFIDACHARGIAVILDVVYNHIDLPSPLGALYWNEATNQPAPDNPWLNQQAPHAFSVFLDMNHESDATRQYVDKVMRYWLSEFRVDGFRFDLSKGLTQNANGPFDAGPYDASRIAIIKHYADVMWQTSPGAYVILEHFAAQPEEKELVEYGEGMMVWNNLTFAALSLVRGGGGSLGGADYTARGWDRPYGLISYLESHDEERLIYEAVNFGESSGDYNTRELETALDRVAALNTLLFAVPGPKMFWQFAELGYDFPINYCEDGSISNDCRTGPKPIRWDYYQNENRRSLYNLIRSLILFKRNYDVFNTTDFTTSLGGTAKVVKLRSPSLDVVAVANLGLENAQAFNVFPTAGTWYDFFTGEERNVLSPNFIVNLEAGEYHLYTNQPVDLSTAAREVLKEGGFGLEVAPNPSNGQLQLSYLLPQSAQPRLEIFNLYGQRVSATQLGRQGAGWHSQPLSLDLPAGAYVLKLAVDGQVDSQRIIIR